MNKVNDVTGGLFAGMISSNIVTGYIFPVTAALTVIIVGHFVRRWLQKRWPVNK